MSRPGNDLIQLRLFADYASNLPLYPKLHAYLLESHLGTAVGYIRPFLERTLP